MQSIRTNRWVGRLFGGVLLAFVGAADTTWAGASPHESGGGQRAPGHERYVAPEGHFVQYEGHTSAPSVAQVQTWTLESAGLRDVGRGVLVRQARLRGALPLVRLRGTYDRGARRSFDTLDLQDDRVEDADYRLGLWLEWDLAELAAGPALAQAQREQRAQVELRQALLAQASMAYFDRRRLLAEAALQISESVGLATERQLRVDELDATLDALTGGRWSRALSQRGSLGAPGSQSWQDSGETLHPPAQAGRRASGGAQGIHPHSGLRFADDPADRPTDP